MQGWHGQDKALSWEGGHRSFCNAPEWPRPWLSDADCSRRCITTLPWGKQTSREVPSLLPRQEKYTEGASGFRVRPACPRGAHISSGSHKWRLSVKKRMWFI